METITSIVISLVVVMAIGAIAVLAAHVGASGDVDDVEWQEYRCKFE